MSWKRIRRESWRALGRGHSGPVSQQVRFERDHHTNERSRTRVSKELEGRTVRLAGRMMSKRASWAKRIVLRPVKPVWPPATLHQARTTWAMSSTRAIKSSYRRYHRRGGQVFRTQGRFRLLCMS